MICGWLFGCQFVCQLLFYFGHYLATWFVGDDHDIRSWNQTISGANWWAIGCFKDVVCYSDIPPNPLGWSEGSSYQHGLDTAHLAQENAICCLFAAAICCATSLEALMHLELHCPTVDVKALDSSAAILPMISMWGITHDHQGRPQLLSHTTKVGHVSSRNKCLGAARFTGRSISNISRFSKPPI